MEETGRRRSPLPHLSSSPETLHTPPATFSCGFTVYLSMHVHFDASLECTDRERGTNSTVIKSGTTCTQTAEAHGDQITSVNMNTPPLSVSRIILKFQ